MSNAVEHRPVRHRSRAVPQSTQISGAVSDDLASPTTSENEADYAVGFGRPPVEHRFKPGQSGNPKGRPKGAKGVDATIRHAMEQKVVVRSGGKTKKVSGIEALVLKLRERALQGDPRAIEKLLGLYRMAAPDEAVVLPNLADEDMSPADDVILVRYRAAVLAEIEADAVEAGEAL